MMFIVQSVRGLGPTGNPSETVLLEAFAQLKELCACRIHRLSNASELRSLADEFSMTETMVERAAFLLVRKDDPFFLIIGTQGDSPLLKLLTAWSKETNIDECVVWDLTANVLKFPARKVQPGRRPERHSGYPPVEFLEVMDRDALIDSVQEMGRHLTKALSSFGVPAELDSINCHTAAAYRMTLGQGVRLSDVEKLARDIALQLRKEVVAVFADAEGMGMEVPLMWQREGKTNEAI